MLNLIRSLIPDGLLRAKVLQFTRWASGAAAAWVLTSVYVYLTTHATFLSQASDAAIAATLSAAVAAIVAAAIGAAWSWLDPVKVDAQIEAAKVNTVKTLADAHAQGPQTFDATVKALTGGTF